MRRFATTGDGRILFAVFSGNSRKPWYKVFVGASLETVEPLKEQIAGRYGKIIHRHVGGRSIDEITTRAGKFFMVIPDAADQSSRN